MHRKILLLSLLISNFAAQAQFGWNRAYDIPVDDGTTNLVNAWTGGMNYCQFSNIDFDFDGRDDLFVFDRSCNKWITFLQMGTTGNADFVYAPQYEALFPDDLVDWCLLVDYNCDGLPDIWTSTIGGCRVFKNVGDSGSGHSFELESPILETFVTAPGYMFFSSVDIPALVDVDGDSDIDVLNFGVLGTAVEYHKNMSMENYGTCDSLEFILKNECWGLFSESGATNEVTLWDTLSYPCDGTIIGAEGGLYGGGQKQDRHAGSAVLALDMNNSSTMELVIGDITYKNLNLLWNSGTAPNTNSEIDDDGRYEMAIGNDRGGLTLYESGLISQIGFEEIDLEHHFTIYPNPANQIVYLDFGDLSADDLKGVTFRMLDLSGRYLNGSQIMNTRTQFDMGDLAKGTYLIKIVGNEQSITKKLIVK